MNIGVVKEIKESEERVSLTPEGAKKLINLGVKISVEKEAGLGSGFCDEEYKEAGVQIIEKAEKIWKDSDLIVKVKEPLESEYKYFREGLSIFTFLHLAPNSKLTKELLEKKVLSLGYETLEKENGSLPLLAPMSAVAGRLATQNGANFLLKHMGGEGILLGGVKGVEKGVTVVLGAGIVGENAIDVAVGLGSEVIVIDKNETRLKELKDIYKDKIETVIVGKSATENSIKENALKADLLIGAVHLRGRKTPTLISKEIVKQMKKGSVIIDVSVDQGGCVETLKVTSHKNPTYVVDGVLHYGVPNMPGAVPRTSTLALTNATLPYIEEMAKLGVIEAIKKSKELQTSVNTIDGNLCEQGVSIAQNIEFKDIKEVL